MSRLAALQASMRCDGVLCVLGIDSGWHRPTHTVRGTAQPDNRCNAQTLVAVMRVGIGAARRPAE